MYTYHGHKCITRTADLVGEGVGDSEGVVGASSGIGGGGMSGIDNDATCPCPPAPPPLSLTTDNSSDFSCCCGTLFVVGSAADSPTLVVYACDLRETGSVKSPPLPPFFHLYDGGKLMGPSLNPRKTRLLDMD